MLSFFMTKLLYPERRSGQVQLRAGDTQLNISWAFVAVPLSGCVSTGLLPKPVRKAIDELVTALRSHGLERSRDLRQMLRCPRLLR